MKGTYDILIVGGGMVGCSLACALLSTGWRVAIVEAHSPPASSPVAADPSLPAAAYDHRSVALSYGSRMLLTQLGLWPALAPTVSPIQRVHVSDQGRFACVRLDCQDQGVAALGYVASGNLLGQVLHDHLAAKGSLDWWSPATLVALQKGRDTMQVQITQAGALHTLQARLVVAADGSNSMVRSLLDIKARRWTYGQAAIIANIQTHLDHQQTAYERFTASGPIALLPLAANTCGMIWSATENQAEMLMQSSEAQFLSELQTQFGWRLGCMIAASQRKSFPLCLLQAKQQVLPRVVLLGNAAHTVHPVAGQGFNLSLREVAALAEMLAVSAQQGQDPGDWARLQRYDRQRRGDQMRVLAFTDGLVRLFSNPLSGVGLARNLGMLGISHLPGVRHQLARHAMGLMARMPHLGF